MLKYLKPKELGLKKVRVGPTEDGGYVMPEEVLQNCSAMFVYGIGGEIRYEGDFIQKYRKPVFSYDHTISWSPPSELNHTFEGLGFQENCDDFINHHNKKGIDGEVFLKIDTEGAEYDYFLNADIKRISEITYGLCLEIHWIDKEDIRNKFIRMMDIINSEFILVHTHANNWGDEFEYDGIKIYNVYELSFLNKRHVKNILDIEQDYPIEGLDFPNNRNKPDFVFDFFKGL